MLFRRLAKSVVPGIEDRLLLLELSLSLLEVLCLSLSSSKLIKSSTNSVVF